MRSFCLCVILLLTLSPFCKAVELTSSVNSTDPAFAALRKLAQWGVIADTRSRLADTSTGSWLRYDIASMLVEPLECCMAFVEAHASAPTLRPDQRRRAVMANDFFAARSEEEADELVRLLSQLLERYGSDIDLLSPGMSQRADAALKVLSHAENRTPLTTADSPLIRFRLNQSQPNSLTTPLEFHSTTTPIAETLRPKASTTGADAPEKESSETVPLLTRPASSFEAAVDVALGHFRLYGSVASPPGRDLFEMIREPDGNGTYRLGVEVNLLRIKDLGISTILEYNLRRSGRPESESNSAIGGGIGLSW